MLALAFATGPLNVLCLGAHPDDIEIGCGGTLRQLLAEHPGSACHWVVLSGTPDRAREARASAAQFVSGGPAPTLDVHDFPDGRFPPTLSAIKDTLERVRSMFPANLVFTHYRDDRHQDHRVVSDVAWQTFRDHLILEYEIPKWDGDLGQPNCYVALTRAAARAKTDHLLAMFPSQLQKRWFTEDTFLALLRLRGVECGAAEGYAEAFHARKMLARP